jgi:hypothetical protein
MIIQPVILCGGSGTRLWPLSREQYPKQLLCLNGNHTMLQATALRLDGLALAEGDVLAAPLLVGNEEYRFLIAEQLRQVGVAHPTLVLEPCGRNTAPALTLAALAAQGVRPVHIMPAIMRSRCSLQRMQGPPGRAVNWYFWYQANCPGNGLWLYQAGCSTGRWGVPGRSVCRKAGCCDR